ncbi:type VI secretion system tip protein VgrG [Ramlibacter sp. AW1]|uniref:Type VI secretion system tip protein VgrG n=1 Tax=Ramlibacter aurantiacus TaxID=2801330 RepID=A0A936ZNR3_9BURK|nr:type VI secretion system tip protein TssI/VgrG [Ramlibacter aurantiacus]MBL0419621.1 type VI secretion system tip protein VgrG [Ramlibacter aurantiacus]
MAKPALALASLRAPQPLLLSAVSMSEELSRPFEFEVEALAENLLEHPEELLAQPVGLSLTLGDGTSQRHFHGIVTSIALQGTAGRRFAYRLQLRPWLWLLTKRTDIRIFQKLTVEQITRQVMQHYGGDHRFELAGTNEPLDYCVQYRETDFDFVSRLFEQEGIYYFFEHEEDKHILVLTDDASAHRPFPGAEQITYRHGLLDRSVNDCISDWQVAQELRPTRSMLRDYDFTRPSVDLTQSDELGDRRSPAELDTYDYPGLYTSAGEGRRRASLRAQEQQSLQERIAGAGDSRLIACGHRFRLDGAPAHGQGEYVFASTRITATVAGSESGQGDARFQCAFTAFEASTPYRPARRTPRPVVSGPQTATVVGPAGEEIYTDEHGRVKLHFHWDRLGKRDQDSSCWVRVAQPLAGDGFGFMALPRIGQEVVVDFLEGDPDRPLVTGRVYNGAHSPPYALPEHKTVATMKSRSTPGGTAQAFNELRFEDKAGEEYVWLQAQKDLFVEIEADRHVHVGNDEYRIVERHLKEEIKGRVDRTVAQDVKEQVQGQVALVIDQDSAIEVKGQYGLKVTGDLAMQTQAGASLKAGGNWDAKVGANLGIDAAANVHIKAGANIVIEAGAMITLKAGGASVVVGPAEVAITGAMVRVNSGGSPGAGAGSSPKAPKQAEAPQKPEQPADKLTHMKG